MTGCPVPAHLGDGDDRVTVQRAWPHGGRLVFAGVDGSGRARTGRIAEGGRARVAAYADDPSLPGLADAARGAKLVAHRFGRRAVLARDADYLKISRDPVALLQVRAELGHELGVRAGFWVPRARSEGTHALASSVLRGRLAHELGDEPESWQSGWLAWGRRWARLVQGRVPNALPRHDAAAEIGVVEQWVQQAEAYAALDRTRLRAGAELVRRGLAEAPVGRLAVCHRDLHDKQILFDGARVGVLDFDTLSLADPALDLANLLQHAELRRAQRVWPPAAAVWLADVVHEVAAEVGVRPGTLAAYRRAAALRLACVYAFRPRWHELAQLLLAQAVGVPAVDG